jgi:hypothetical protein
MVIVVSFEVENIFLKLKLGVLTRFVLLIDFLIIEAIAFVITTCALVVLLPFSKTNPTKLSVAHLALHMVATLVLLNWFSTFWIWT